MQDKIKVSFSDVRYDYNKADEFDNANNLKASDSHNIAVDGLSFEIKAGEFICILGHNGSGKSSTAKLINALILADEGNILVDGISPKDEDGKADDSAIIEIRRNCGMVFQNPDNQIIAGIVEDDVAFGPENLGIEPSEIRSRVDDSLEKVGMTEFIHRQAHQLSGGQKQRIAIAGVLAMKPSCIIFDEPTAMLDPVGRREVLNVILELKREGITIILITHHTEDALLSDRVIVMKEGKIAMQGKPTDIFVNSEFIEDLSLEVPETIKIVNELKKNGIEIECSTYTKDEVVEKICQYARKI